MKINYSNQYWKRSINTFYRKIFSWGEINLIYFNLYCYCWFPKWSYLNSFFFGKRAQPTTAPKNYFKRSSDSPSQILYSFVYNIIALFCFLIIGIIYWFYIYSNYFEIFFHSPSQIPYIILAELIPILKNKSIYIYIYFFFKFIF